MGYAVKLQKKSGENYTFGNTWVVTHYASSSVDGTFSCPNYSSSAYNILNPSNATPYYASSENIYPTATYTLSSPRYIEYIYYSGGSSGKIFTINTEVKYKNSNEWVLMRSSTSSYEYINILRICTAFRIRSSTMKTTGNNFSLTRFNAWGI